MASDCSLSFRSVDAIVNISSCEGYNLVIVNDPIKMVCSDSSSVFALKTRQKKALESIFTVRSSLSDEWKVLVCDFEAQTIVDALFEISQLRSFGITLKTLIDKPRGAVSDAPALYIVAATPHNVAWLTKDLSASPPLYDRTSVAFLTSVSPSLLSALAAQLPIPSSITSVYDLHSRYISLEQNLFSLNMKNSFLGVTQAAEDDAKNRAFMERVVDGLFSVLITLGVVPIIRTQLGGAAKAIGAALSKKLRDNLDIFQRASVSSRALAFRRPLLLLVDRTLDFNPIMYHSWTYQSLVHDCLELKLNRVKVEVPSPSGDKPSTLKSYVLDKQNDSFWSENAFSPFPVVAESVEAALKKYREDVASINMQGSATADSKSQSESDGTGRLVEAISSLPELTRQKEIIDMHTNIATTLLNNINNRSLDTYFDLESQLMKERAGPAASHLHDEYKAPLMELLQPRPDDGTTAKRGEGTPTDRLRMFLMFYDTFGERLSAGEMDQYKSVLAGVGADSSAVDYITQSRGYQHDNVPIPQTSNSGTLNTARLKGLMKRVVNRGYRSITNVAQNAKNLVVDQTAMFTTARTLEVFIKDSARDRDETFAANVLEEFALFDPKVLVPTSDSIRYTADPVNNSQRRSQRKAHHTLFSDAIVFTVGGGNYVEFENCLEVANRGVSAGAAPNILYGTTEMVTAGSFISQMCSALKATEEQSQDNRS